MTETPWKLADEYQGYSPPRKYILDRTGEAICLVLAPSYPGHLEEEMAGVEERGSLILNAVNGCHALGLEPAGLVPAVKALKDMAQELSDWWEEAGEHLYGDDDGLAGLVADARNALALFRAPAESVGQTEVAP